MMAAEQHEHAEQQHHGLPRGREQARAEPAVDDVLRPRDRTREQQLQRAGRHVLADRARGEHDTEVARERHDRFE
jgi:hypothetical protein